MNYANGKIYTIRSFQTDKVYYGSTTQPLSKRFSKHKKDFKNYTQGNFSYISSFEILQYDDAYIELVENFSCENKEQLQKREGEIIRDNLTNCANKRIEGRTGQQYYLDNKEKIDKQHKQYYSDNKAKIDARNKQWTEINKDKIKTIKQQYYLNNKDEIDARNQQYYLHNKDEIDKKHQQYYLNNKDKIKIRSQQNYFINNKEKITCECGSIYTKHYQLVHFRTKKHINFINNQQKELKNDNF